MSAEIEQRNQEATCYVGNLDEQVSEELLWELMLQVGPVINVHIPKDKVTSRSQGYGFVEFRTELDAEYAIKVMNMIKLYGKPIRCNKASQDKRVHDIGANLFIGNLDPDVDEKLLYDTFSAFGGITQTPKIMRDTDVGNSKGYGFISYDSFEAADLAIECMNGQFFCNRQIVVQYAFKKDSKGERHGSQIERMLAANNPDKLRPHTLFATGYGQTPTLASGQSFDPNLYPTHLPPLSQMGYNLPPVQSAPLPPLPPPPPQTYQPQLQNTVHNVTPMVQYAPLPHVPPPPPPQFSQQIPPPPPPQMYYPAQYSYPPPPPS